MDKNSNLKNLASALRYALELAHTAALDLEQAGLCESADMMHDIDRLLLRAVSKAEVVDMQVADALEECGGALRMVSAKGAR